MYAVENGRAGDRIVLRILEELSVGAEYVGRWMEVLWEGHKDRV
jgi:hypothetical protein